MKRIILAAFLLLGVSQSALLADTYFVTIDTSSIAGAGFIDIQFNPAPGSSPGGYELGQAVISNFVLSGAGAALGAEAAPPVSATGTLQPGPLTIENLDPLQLNGVFYEATFGSLLTFQLDLTGAAYTAVNQVLRSDFSIGLYGTNGSIVGIASLLGGGAIDPSLSSPEASFTAASSVPEPGVWLPMALSGVLVFAVRRQVAR